MDHSDIVALLRMARRRSVQVLPLQGALEESIPEPFIEAAKERVIEHIEEHPECEDDWRMVGFDSDASYSDSIYGIAHDHDPPSDWLSD